MVTPSLADTRSLPKNVAEFLKLAEDLADQITNSEVDVGMAILRGLADKNKKKQISFECHKDSAFTFKKGKKTYTGGLFRSWEAEFIWF